MDNTVFQDSGPGNAYMSLAASKSPYASALTNNGYVIVIESVPCFVSGSKILTVEGYKPIENLRKGELVKTLSQGYKAVEMVGTREIIHHAKEERIKDQLYICKKEEYPEMVEETLILTGCHSILVSQYKNSEEREHTIEVNGNTYVTEGKYRLPACCDVRASVYETPGTYRIFHVALENEDEYMNYGIYANGLLVETCSKRYLKECSRMEIL